MSTSRFQQGVDRLRRARSGVPDRVPVVAQTHELAMRWTDTPCERFYTDAGALVAAIVRTSEDFGLDAPGISYDVYNIELEAMGQGLAFLPWASPVLDTARPLLAGRADLALLAPPEPGAAGRMSFVVDVQRRFREATGIEPTIQFCAPFTMAAQARGYERFVEDVCLDPGFAHDLLAFMTERVIAPWIRFQKAALPGAGVAVGADALCSPPMVSLPIIEEFSIPYILRLRELCPVPVAVVNWWGDSLFDPVDRLLELKRRVCCGLIRAQDPDVARVGAGPFKRFAERHGLVLELGVGDALLNRGPVEEITSRIRAYLRDAAPGGRLILYLASLNAETPPEHVRAAVAAAHAFGLYDGGAAG
jgi:uroporphyrinogen-III decarboxylase